MIKKRNIKLNTDAHSEAFASFLDAVRSIESREGWRSAEVVREFLNAAFRAMRGKFLFGPAWDANEKEYMAIVKRCQKPQETMTDISRMLGSVATAMIAEPIDFLGPVFEEVSASGDLGQFFTPYALSRTIAELVLGDAVDMLKEKSFITIGEPACGVGGMTLAANMALREKGIDIARQVHWDMVDVDHRAMCGAYLQAALSDASAEVIHGNTLRLDVWCRSFTPAAILFPKLKGEEPIMPPPPAAPTPAQGELPF